MQEWVKSARVLSHLEAGAPIKEVKVAVEVSFLPEVEGMCNERPTIRKVWPSWDLMVVLEKLNTSPFEPIE